MRTAHRSRGRSLRPLAGGEQHPQGQPVPAPAGPAAVPRLMERGVVLDHVMEPVAKECYTYTRPRPAASREIASFVPPAGHNPVKPPQRGVLSQMPQVWGVYYDAERDLVLASDMNTGLWILRVTA